jgi:hypothetical protein
MKKVIIIGASGSLAHYVIEALKHLQNVEITLFVRNKSSLSKSIAEDCTVIEGDATNYNSVKTISILLAKLRNCSGGPLLPKTKIVNKTPSLQHGQNFLRSNTKYPPTNVTYTHFYWSAITSRHDQTLYNYINPNTNFMNTT